MALCPPHPVCPSSALTGAPADPAVGRVVPAVAVPSSVLATARTRPALGHFAAPPGDCCAVGACRERDKVRMEKGAAIPVCSPAWVPAARGQWGQPLQQHLQSTGHCSRRALHHQTCTQCSAHNQSPTGKQGLRCIHQHPDGITAPRSWDGAGGCHIFLQLIISHLLRRQPWQLPLPLALPSITQRINPSPLLGADGSQPHGRDGKGLGAHLAASGDARDKSLP